MLHELGEIGVERRPPPISWIRSVPMAAASLMTRFHSSVVMVPCPCVGPASA
ncbi:hypothetical protein [Streptomyces sp. NPDC094031]|uniref:hypothetical protein n=1 Tax=Streptomyces sp. NPDC094031 TaxID=3155307 RepID=UPI00332C7E0A